MLKLYYKVASSQLPAPRVLKLYCKVASSQLPAPQILRVLKLYYKVASSHLPAPQILRVLKLYYKVASSQLPATQILRVLKLYYKVASSHLPAPQILRVLKLYYKVASSQLPAPQIAPRTKVVLQSRQFSSSRPRHARSPQRVARTASKSHSRLHFAHSTRTISAEGCARSRQVALSPAFRALDTHDLRRGLRAQPANRTLACISRTRHARSPQRVARTPDKSHSRLHFAHSTRPISAEGCAHTGQIALSPAFRALDTHDLRRGLRAHRTNRTLTCISRTRHARSPQRVALSVDAVRPALRL